MTLTRTACLAIIAAGILGLTIESAKARTFRLQSEAIREAYFLGQSQDGHTLAKFFNKYVRDFPCPDNGTCVASVELETPYMQVVEATRTHVNNYSELDAERDYAARTPAVILNVEVTFAPNYSAPTTVYTADGDDAAGSGDTYFYGFQFHVTQQGKVLHPRKVSEQYSDFGDASGSGCDGCVNENRVYLEFDPAQVHSGLLDIDITSPEGKTVSAEYDLDQLK